MSDTFFRLYTVFHKPFYIPPVDFVVPIHAGKCLSKQPLPMLGDDSGENISALNPCLSEFTALYWIWKNAGHVPNDIWGLCHYRRYFAVPRRRLLASHKKLISLPPAQAAIDRIVNKQLGVYIQHQFEHFDVVVQEPIYAYRKKGTTLNLEQHYNQDHRAADWQLMKEVVLELYPQYTQSLNTFCRQHTLSFAHMMIARHWLWNDYLSWLFPILFALKDRITLAENDTYQSRALAFIGERLMNLYLLHTAPRIGYMPIAVFDK
jgi:hypothetical protein